MSTFEEPAEQQRWSCSLRSGRSRSLAQGLLNQTDRCTRGTKPRRGARMSYLAPSAYLRAVRRMRHHLPAPARASDRVRFTPALHRPAPPRCCFIQLASCGAPLRQYCTETVLPTRVKLGKSRLIVANGMAGPRRTDQARSTDDCHFKVDAAYGGKRITSHGECGRCTAIRIRRDLLKCGLLHLHGCPLAHTNWLIGGRRRSQMLGPACCPFAAVPRGRSFPSEDRPFPFGSKFPFTPSSPGSGAKIASWSFSGGAVECGNRRSCRQALPA